MLPSTRPKGVYPVSTKNGKAVYDYAREQYDLSRLATERGLDRTGCWDYAIPASWSKNIKKLTGISPVGQIVWYYPEGSYGGFAEPITRAGEIILAIEKWYSENDPDYIHKMLEY